MARFFRLVRAATLAVSVVVSPVFASDADQNFNDFLEEVFDRAVNDSPEFKAQLGVKDSDYARFGDYSDAEVERQHKIALADLARLERDFDYDALSPEAQTSYNIFRYQLDQQIRNFPWRYHSYAFSQQDSTASFLPVVLQNWHQIENEADAEAYIGRVRDAERVMDQLIANIDTRNEMGIAPPRFVFPHIIRDTTAIISGSPIDESDETNAIYADFSGKLTAAGIEGARKEALLQEAREALRGPFAAGYRRFLKKVRETQALADSNGGVWRLPEGLEFYQNRIEAHTTLQGLTADEIHAYGLAEVERIHKEMAAIQHKVGVEGSLADFFKYARTSPNNFYPDTDEGRNAYLALAKQYIDALYEKTDAFFNVLPKAPLEVRAVEKWREATASGAFYSQPSPDGSRPGIFYVNLSDMSAQQIHVLESLAYHEGAPGHHFQIAIAQELEGLPRLRRFALFGAYIEGWALYAEALAKEMGLFTDPMSDFGRLQYELLRAVRLVVDTGAHTRKWSREQVIEYMRENTPMSLEEIESEAERYLVIPGQALSYKIGMRHIQQLRARAEQELGEKFDIRSFHDVVLQNGATPMPVLEKLVEQYIESAQ